MAARPPMRKGSTGNEFLRSRASSLVACHFLSVHTLTLKRFYALFFFGLDTRCVYLTGVTAHSTWSRVTQQART